MAAVDVIDVTALWSPLGLRRSAIGWAVGCAMGLLVAAPLVWFTEVVLPPSEKELATAFAVISAVVCVVVAAVTGIAPPSAPGLWSLRYLLRRRPLAVGATIVAMVVTTAQGTIFLTALPALALSAMRCRWRSRRRG